MLIIKKLPLHYSQYPNHKLYRLASVKNIYVKKETNDLFNNNYNSLTSSFDNAKKSLLKQLLIDIESFPIVPDNNHRYQLRQFIVEDNNKPADAFIASAQFDTHRIIYLVKYDGYKNNIHYFIVMFLNYGLHEVPITDKKKETKTTPYSDTSFNNIKHFSERHRKIFMKKEIKKVLGMTDE